jgi:hypothetical protein
MNNYSVFLACQSKEFFVKLSHKDANAETELLCESKFFGSIVRIKTSLEAEEIKRIEGVHRVAEY